MNIRVATLRNWQPRQFNKKAAKYLAILEDLILSFFWQYYVRCNIASADGSNTVAVVWWMAEVTTAINQ